MPPDGPTAAPPAVPSAARPGAGLGGPALLLGASGTVAVAVATGLSIDGPPPLTGLALASVGLVLGGGGLVLGTVGAIRGGVRRSRTAVAAAGLSLAGLSAALIWLAAFVITVLSGAGPSMPVGGEPFGCAGP
ncbi:hypothetical protein [Pseudonocardia sp. NPDC049635]|uniref:hypothetical protein n=1 Tax=Pseudonocardia sp. NPDC049635 TaxID=3155506 RepID=UPI0033F09930